MLHPARSRIAAGWVAASLLVLAGSVQAQPAAALAFAVPFTVFAQDGKTKLYRGEYRIERTGAAIAESQRYQTADGKLAKLDESVYDTERRRPVSFVSANYMTGDVFRLAVKGDALTWRLEDSAGGVKSSSEDTLPAGTFIWPNLVYVLAQEWEPIARGQPVSVDLYIVSRKLKVGLDLKPDGKVTVGGVPGIRVKIEPSSWVFRQLADDAWVTLAVEPPHHLLRFEGKGAIKGPNGDDPVTQVVFDWSLAKAAVPLCASGRCPEVARFSKP